MIYELKDHKASLPLFGKWEETMIWSCLHGIMGRIYVDNLRNPAAAKAILGDFAFFAGKVNKELVSHKPDWCTQDFMIMVPQDEGWENAIMECYGDKARKVTRFAIKKEPDIFDEEKLEKASVSLPDGYQSCMMDEALYHKCKSQAWSADLVAQFPTYEDYDRLGLGVVIMKGQEIVSGASSYSRYQEGIEIEIDTREDHRRKGLAYACGARLILECLKRNLYPSWDAQNQWSVALAEKLGYHYSHAYTGFEVF